MRIRRNTGGFTLLELALVAAIIGILSGVTAVNVVHYQRTLTQVELDGIAREIFVAAQNHLTMAESQNFMGVPSTAWGRQYVQSDKEKEVNGTLDIHYYVVAHSLDRNSLNMLNLMLPFASVDETVLECGSYIIRYQKDPALVLDVFYAVAEPTLTDRDETINRKFAYTFTEEDENWIREYRGSGKKQARGDYESKHAIIGWHGVDPEWFSVQSGGETPTPVPKGEPLSPPTVKVVNAEQLYVEVSNPNTSDKFKKAGLRLIVEGEQSGQVVPITLRESKDTLQEIMKPSFRVVLDDVTDKEQDKDNNRNHHFQHVCSGLYPGEDITVYAVAYNNHELTNIAESAHAKTNSLFASLEQHPALTLEIPATAKISNFRHLENMDSAISNIKIAHLLGQEHDYYQIDGKETIQITQAEQTSDMDWNLFKNAVGENILDKNGAALTANYWPVTNGAEIKSYNGKGHKISNVKINVPGDAGLFAKLGHSSTVADLELVNFSVDSSRGNAGALAGVLRDKSTVQSVLVHHETDKFGDNYKVTGKSAAGGLVGLVEGACTIARSAAAVYVKSTLATGHAGGLIGKIDNASGTEPVTVSESYAGGHTQNGGYEKDNCNVTARTSAGGLIGSSTGNLTVKHCYAATSVEGSTNAGGFIGDVEGGTITSCYATGYVTGDPANPDMKKGAFAGKVSGTMFSDSGYFTSVENEEEDKNKELDKRLKSVGRGNDDGIASFDQECCKFGGYHAVPNAKPYDISALDGKAYPFQTVSELDSGVTSPDWMSIHYGDWPNWLEALVVNE